MSNPENNVSELTDAELDTLALQVDAEQNRRRLTGRVHEINIAALIQADIHRGEPWRQPTSAVDAYPSGWTLVHDSKQWVNLIDGNVWEPGVTGWRELTEGEPPEWVQPLGSHDAYDEGARVVHDGSVYVSLVPWNVWPPTTAQWRVEPSDDDNGEENDPDDEPDVVEWEPGQTVTTGDVRTFNGATYTCLQTHTTQNGWEPPAVPALWEKQ